MSIKLVSSCQLQEQLQNGTEISIFDARQSKHYIAGHIPGAVHTEWEFWSGRPKRDVPTVYHEPGWWGVLDDPVAANFAAKLEQLGLSSTKPVVVYADGWISNGREGRIAWMLLYLGFTDVAILNGGWRSWLANNYPITQELSAPQPGKVELSLQEHRRLTFYQVKKRYETGSPTPIDTRSEAEFAGAPYDYETPRTGRMPGAVNLPYKHLFDSEGRFVEKDSLMELLAQHWQKDLISTCEVGVKASTFAVLVEVYTGRIIPVYDGSIMEWSVCPEVPIVRDSASD